MQSYEINAQETWETNPKYAKVNWRILQNIWRIATVVEQHSQGRGSPVPRFIWCYTSFRVNWG